ncbi:hypothetical protein QZH41_008698, partial [Actinostola sp. cb2023]
MGAAAAARELGSTNARANVIMSHDNIDITKIGLRFLYLSAIIAQNGALANCCYFQSHFHPSGNSVVPAGDRIKTGDNVVPTTAGRIVLGDDIPESETEFYQKYHTLAHMPAEKMKLVVKIGAKSSAKGRRSKTNYTGKVHKKEEFHLVRDQHEINLVFIWLMVLIVVGEFLEAPTFILADTALLQKLQEKKKHYGKTRLFGSLGYATASFIVGAVLETTRYTYCGQSMNDYNYLFYIFAVVMGLTFIFGAVLFEFNYDDDENGILQGVYWGLGGGLGAILGGVFIDEYGAEDGSREFDDDPRTDDEVMETIEEVYFSDASSFDPSEYELKEEDYPGAITLCLECEKAARAFKHYKCISELSSNLQETLIDIEALWEVMLNYHKVICWHEQYDPAMHVTTSDVNDENKDDEKTAEATYNRNYIRQKLDHGLNRIW